MDVDSYLDRLELSSASPIPDAEWLKILHRAHVTTIPFENLDVALGRGIDLDIDVLQDKLLHRKRGGYCFEHNLLFAAVLEQLGFPVVRLAGRVIRTSPGRGPIYFFSPGPMTGGGWPTWGSAATSSIPCRWSPRQRHRTAGAIA